MQTPLTDDQILDGLKQHDEAITRQYFYDYCRMAYCLCNRRYRLDDEYGLDFYSLAHEYYLTLDKHQWRQMEDRKPGSSLRAWMIGGFRFLVLDKLKQASAERRYVDIEARAERRVLAFPDDDESALRDDVRKTVEEVANTFYGRDSVGSMILKLMLIDGYKGKEVAEMMSMTPSAISQRYHKMMREVIEPYFLHHHEPLLVGIAPKRMGHVWGESAPFAHNYAAPVPADMSPRTTPHVVTTLQENEIFVFGSNLRGIHGGGAARVAFQHFGAIMGQGVGLQGQSYAIPTMQGGTHTIRPYVYEFIFFAQQHPQLRFLVIPIGCGIAGFSPEEIAPLFDGAEHVENICLPADFWRVLL